MVTFHARRLAPLVFLGGLVLGCAPSSPAAARTAPAVAKSAAAATLATAPDLFLTTGDVRLRYRDIGRGEPVVLLHGYSRSLADWYGIADSLAVNHRVIALDVRGFGQSSKLADPARYGKAMVDDVTRLLDHLGLRQAHRVGHSMGAILAADFAVSHPTRVRTVTLAAGAFRDSTGFAQLVAPSIASLERGDGLRPLLTFLFPMWNDSLVTVVNRDVIATNDRSVLLAVLRNPPPSVAPAQAASVRVPTLAIVGSADPLSDDSRRVAEWWPGAREIVVDGANHGDITSRPEFLAAVRAHLGAR
jgi:pimeloyl-ACP methyl ester carboxylesterase